MLPKISQGMIPLNYFRVKLGWRGTSLRARRFLKTPSYCGQRVEVQQLGIIAYVVTLASLVAMTLIRQKSHFTCEKPRYGLKVLLIVVS